jgi:glycosyltransferase involved in cell wall biosynthesis
MNDPTLRVAMTTPRYLPERGGTAIHTFEVARRMVEVGVAVTVITTTFERADRGTTIEDGIRVARVKASPKGTDYYFAPALIRELQSASFDIVHCQGYHTLVAPISMATALARHVPYVVTFHSGGHSSRVRRAIRPLHIRMLGPLLRRSDALVAVSEFEANLFGARLRIPRSALTVVPSGVELPAAERDDEVITPERLVLSVGRVESYKGHHRVIEALPLLREADPQMRLRIVGSGPFERDLRRLATKLGVSDAVDIRPVDAAQRTELAQLLRRAAVVAVLSDYESQGLAAYEALALGRPVVVTDNSALAELGTRPNVRTVAPSATPRTVATAILELAGRAPQPAGDYPTWRECVASLLGVYDAVLARRRSSMAARRPGR